MSERCGRKQIIRDLNALPDAVHRLYSGIEYVGIRLALGAGAGTTWGEGLLGARAAASW